MVGVFKVKLDLRKNVSKISSDLKIACFHEKFKKSTRQPKYLERCKSKKQNKVCPDFVFY